MQKLREKHYTAWNMIIAAGTNGIHKSDLARTLGLKPDCQVDSVLNTLDALGNLCCEDRGIVYAYHVVRDCYEN